MNPVNTEYIRCPRCTSPQVVGAAWPDLAHEIMYWECDLCDFRWHRFSQDSEPDKYRLAALLIGR